MTKGISLHVGVNKTNAGGQPLVGCVNDAKEMACLAKKHGFEGREVVADEAALLLDVIAKIKAIATQLEDGDFFFFTFSGHGSFIGDEDLDELGDDRRDETLVLHDFMLTDDVITRELWPSFAPGVRIVSVADSCHSGGVAPMLTSRLRARREETVAAGNLRMSVTRDIAISTTKSATVKTLEEPARQQHIARNRKFYADMYSNSSLSGAPVINASVLQLAACEAEDTTADGSPNSVFTQKLLDVLRRPTPPGNYTDLRAEIATLLVATQIPQLIPVGVSNPGFLNATPFII